MDPITSRLHGIFGRLGGADWVGGGWHGVRRRGGSAVGWRVPAKRRHHAPASPLRRHHPNLRAGVPAAANVAPGRAVAVWGHSRPWQAHRDQPSADRGAQSRAAVHQLPPRPQPGRLGHPGGGPPAARSVGRRLCPEWSRGARDRRHDRAPTRQAHPRQGHLPRPGSVVEGSLRQGQRPALAEPDAAGPDPVGGTVESAALDGRCRSSPCWHRRNATAASAAGGTRS